MTVASEPTLYDSFTERVNYEQDIEGKEGLILTNKIEKYAQRAHQVRFALPEKRAWPGV